MIKYDLIENTDSFSIRAKRYLYESYLFSKKLITEDNDKTLISKEEKEFYDIVKEKWNYGKNPKDTMDMESAYNKEGKYIGDLKTAKKLAEKYGIKQFELADPKDNVVSIGFNPDKKLWYGWSHRAIYGFGVGDIVKEGDCCAMSGFTEDYLKKHPEDNKSLPIGFEAKTLDDAKKMAIAFAESVS
jgi:hypothetical protein